MYLHIGQNITRLTGEIVGVFDLDNASHGKDTRRLLNRAERDHQLTVIGDDLPRTFVLLEDGNAYLTPISPGTIAKRITTQEVSQWN